MHAKFLQSQTLYRREDELDRRGTVEPLRIRRLPSVNALRL